MFIKHRSKSRSGYTLVEVLVATGLFSLAGVALGSIYLFSTTSFAAMANYAELDKINRNAMDILSKEIRQAQAVTAATGSSLTIINGDGVNVNYSFNSYSGKLLRTVGSSSQILLSDCKLLDLTFTSAIPSAGPMIFTPQPPTTFRRP